MSSTYDPNAPNAQPLPVSSHREPIAALVRKDLEERQKFGTRKYGTPLQAFNERNAVQDAYEEVLDLACYLKQMLVEQGETSRADKE